MSASTDIALFSEPRPSRFSMMRRIADSYLGRAFLSPFHGIVLGALASACMFSQSALPVVFGVPLAEVLVLGALPRWDRFRRRVDELRRERDRLQRERDRTALMIRMGEDHRCTLNELERLAAIIRSRVPFDDAGALADLRVDELIDTYARIAVAHDEAEVLVDRMRLEDRAIGLEADAAGGRIAELAQRRRACRRDNEKKLAKMVEQLRTIEEAVKLLHERTVLAVDVTSINERVDTFLAEIEEGGSLVEAFLSLAIDHDRAV
jgi:hypothetical protein